MEAAIDDALWEDFGATLEWAVTLRQEFFMRFNPQVILVRAALHPERKAFTQSHPGRFDQIEQQVMSRADDALVQISYFLYLKGGKKRMPSILKRSWAKKISALDAYEAAKYKNAEIGLVNAARMVHAHSPVLDELMQTGKITLPERKRPGRTCVQREWIGRISFTGLPWVTWRFCAISAAFF